MQKPDDMPEDIWAVADEVRTRIFNAMHDDDGRLTDNDPSEIVARAILAERERCEAEWATKLMHAEVKAILSDRDEAGQRCSASLASEQDPQNPNRRVLFAVKSPGDEDDERT